MIRCFSWAALVGVLFASPIASCKASAQHDALAPHRVIEKLSHEMYRIGETQPDPERFASAERKAAEEVRGCVGQNANAPALVEKNASGDTPLIAAAHFGYSRVVVELLKSARVRSAVDEVNAKGLSAWAYASFAPRQTAWLCNPSFLSDPMASVPVLVEQPFYTTAESPYLAVRRALEAAGSKADHQAARRSWLEVCARADPELRREVADSPDLLQTLLPKAAPSLNRLLQSGHQAEQAESKQHWAEREGRCGARDAAACIEIARSHAAGANIAAAVPFYRKACAAGDPDGCFGIATYLAGEAYSAKDGPEKARLVGEGLAAVDVVIRKRPTHWRALTFKGLLLRMKPGNLEARRTALEEAQELQTRARSLRLQAGAGGTEGARDTLWQPAPPPAPKGLAQRP